MLPQVDLHLKTHMFMKKKPKRGKELPFEFPYKEGYQEAAYDALVKRLRYFSPELKDEELHEVFSYCSYFEYEKDAILVDFGEVCDRVYFTLKGTLTAYKVKANGKDHYCWFMTKEDVVISVESFYLQIPSKEQLFALKESACVSLPARDLKMLSDKYPAVKELDLQCTRYYYLLSNRRNEMIGMTAREKFETLLRDYPHLTKEENVTNTALASFLGMTREHLSKIRKEFGQ